MSYRIDEETGDLVIEGFEDGIATSPHKGIANMQNANISTETGEVMASFNRVKQSQTAGTGTFTRVNTNTVSVSGITLLVGTWVTILVDSGTGLSGTYYYISSGKLSRTFGNDTTTIVSGINAGTATFSVTSMASPVSGTTETYIDSNNVVQYRYYVLDASGNIWVHDTATLLGNLVKNQSFLTTSGNYTVPSDWNSTNNTIECIGGGGVGGTTAPGAGGGGGAYARISNLTLTPAASIAYVVGTGAGQTSQTFSSTTTWVAPSGVSSIQVECWAGGGGGGSPTGNGYAGGAGGGAYSKKATLSVTPGNSYTVTVGTGGTGASSGSGSNGGTGGDTWFSTTGTVLAKGGAGSSGSNASGASGGASGSGVGDVKNSGGNGGNGTNVTGPSGGGGGAGDSGGVGGNGSGSTGGTAGSGGVAGAGGNGSNAGGSNGISVGGGGGGGGSGAGGTGADGRIKIIYLTVNEDTYFNGASLGASSVGAQGGTDASGSTPGVGGSIASSVGTIKNGGGNGGTVNSTFTGGGGGGSAGYYGNGSNGSQGSTTLGGNGGDGDRGGSTTIGGAGATTSGIAGTAGTEYDATHGSGGGGAGGGVTGTAPSAVGGAGGLYGAGGGGNGSGGSATGPGSGKSGLIVVIYYTTTTPTDTPVWFLAQITSNPSSFVPGGLCVLNGWLSFTLGTQIYWTSTENLGRAYTQTVLISLTTTRLHVSFAGHQGKMYTTDGNIITSLFPNTSLLTGAADIQSYASYTSAVNTGFIADQFSGSLPTLGSGNATRIPALFFTTGTLPTAIASDTIYYIQYGNDGGGTTGVGFFSVYAAASGGTALNISSGAIGMQYFNTFSPTTGGAGTYTFTNQRLNLPFFEIAQSIVELGNTVLIGGITNTIYPWDQVSALPGDILLLPENNVVNMINVNNMAYIFAGSKGNIYISNGSSVSLAIKVPDYCAGIAGTPSTYIEPYFTWGGADYLRGRIYFSILDQTASKTGNCGGIWSFVPTQNFYIGQDTGVQLKLENQNSYGTYNGVAPVILGSRNQTAIGPQYWSAWYSSISGPTYGIDFSDTVSSTTTVIETDLIPVGTQLRKFTFSQIGYKTSSPLVNGESITVKHRKDSTSAYASTNTMQVDSTQLSGVSGINFDNLQWLQLQIILSSLGTSSSTFCRLTEIRLIK